jgi:hypothetical protein
MSLARLCAGAFLVAGLMAASPVTYAQEDSAPVTQDGASLNFDAVGHRFSVPLPDWLTPAERLSPDVIGLVEHNTYADPMQAFVEFFPKGQSLEHWSTTYVARVTKEAGRTLADYRSATVYGYSKTCKPEAMGVFYFGEETPDFFPALGFVCGAYLDNIASLRGQGEIMVSVFRKTDSGIAVVYQEWKGPAFDPSNPATWPVSRENLQARADQLQADAKFVARTAS